MTINIAIIGLGYHAKRIYVPSLIKLKEKYDVKLSLVVDLEEKREDIKGYLVEKNIVPETIFISEEQRTIKKLPKELEDKLRKKMRDLNIEGVIISTEPLVHRMYAEFALKNNINILMDKPISTKLNISNDVKKARELIKDYDFLNKKYLEAKKRGRIAFSMMAQRRYHGAYLKIKELIREVQKKTNCPVTSIQSFHCDGQWRFPTEIINQTYHPYMQGYGKCSHSGYHFFDIVPYILESGLSEDKQYDELVIDSQFVKPTDFIHQITEQDYENIFGEEYQKYNEYTYDEQLEKMKNFGEIDAYNRLVFKQKGRIITVATINLLHNGFAKRHWTNVINRDLYKGNGRVRHETHIIEQGAFQAIHFHSYQSKEVNSSVNRKQLYGVGGEYHLDIYVFRNSEVIGGKTFEKISVEDLDLNILENQSRGHQEDARLKSVEELLLFIKGKISTEDMLSDFSCHKITSIITSGVHISAIKGNKQKFRIGGLMCHKKG